VSVATQSSGAEQIFSTSSAHASTLETVARLGCARLPPIFTPAARRCGVAGHGL
jgi:hypothetical protein